MTRPPTGAGTGAQMAGPVTKGMRSLIAASSSARRRTLVTAGQMRRCLYWTSRSPKRIHPVRTATAPEL